jgi:hypothetical protein
MNRNTWVIVGAVVVLLLVVGYATGWFWGDVEAPPPAATTAPAPAPAPGAGGATQ